ncbi:4-oxalocrotonate tautomerase [Candidatus Termititenax aidoneus]|uniref:4-oxalocrotonate tautomerase n=1 Tax=Termititenax aidoneus TaxID=2218524 RepID=A0A388TAW8_TERA1|nr:4-oxalocrotonate tautomerase [Candidatus Termititenax aidoneus]
MPVVNIQWLKGRGKEQKQKIAREIENLMIKEAGCNPGDTYIFFQETERENFAESGKLYE